jgi:hypothetical protein
MDVADLSYNKLKSQNSKYQQKYHQILLCNIIDFMQLLEKG